MAVGPSTSQSTGNLIQTTFVWNTSEIQQLNINEDHKRLLVKLYTNLNKIVLALNAKDTGYYVLEEFLTGQQFFSNPNRSDTQSRGSIQRSTFRKVINFGVLPNTTTTTIAHNINILSGYSFTRIYGTATNDNCTSFIPIPYASPTDSENISLEVTNTDIVITTGSDRTSYTTCYIVVEYIKQ